MDKDSLQKKFCVISMNILKCEWKFFHAYSLRNFIDHIDKIKGNTERENIVKSLSNCLTEIETNFKPDIDFSIFLFEKYLKNIIPIYENRLGFWPILTNKVLILSIMVASLVIILLLHHPILEILFCFFIIFLSFKMLTKYFNHKVFGFRY